MTRKRPTIADMRAIKGTRQLTMLRVLNLEEAEAAERAGVDIVSIPPTLILDPQYRDAAPTLFSMPGDISMKSARAMIFCAGLSRCKRPERTPFTVRPVLTPSSAWRTKTFQ